MRSPLVITSVGLHIAVVSGFLVAGLWKLDRLDPGRATFDLAVATPPAAAASGSPSAAKAEPFKRKKVKRITTDIVAYKKVIEETPTRSTEPGDGTGDGSGGTGSGGGSGSGTDPHGTGTCTIPPCGDGKDKKKDEVKTILVPPTVIKGLRTSGETQIHPPPTVRTAMLRDGASKVVAAMRVCVGVDGEVSDVSFLKSSGYAGYDAALDDGLRRWHYRAYEVDGRKVPVCGVVTFVYSIK